jgi:Spy/CpxP family protein refolding chaperone
MHRRKESTMPGRTVRSAVAAIAIAAAALGSAAAATASPSGPCEEVTYVGVCEPLRGEMRMPSQGQQGMADVLLPVPGATPHTVG